MSRFARDLGLSPSRLSEVFSRRQGLSVEVAKRIAGRLELGDREAEQFCDLIEHEHARSAEKRELARLRLMHRREALELRSIALDKFQFISDWYHLAILELVETPFFREDPKWIAGALRISPAEAASAVDRLLRLELLVRDGEGRLAMKEKSVITADTNVSEAMRNFHGQILERAKAAMVTRPVRERSHAAAMLPLRHADLAVVQGKIKRFLTRLARESEPPKRSKDALFCLSVQFFELTEPSVRD